MSISISSQPKRNRQGNGLLASANRRKRVNKGYNLDFTDDLKYSEHNPFGSNSVVSLWNESVAYDQYMRSIGQARPRYSIRDAKGKFTFNN